MRTLVVNFLVILALLVSYFLFSCKLLFLIAISLCLKLQVYHVAFQQEEDQRLEEEELEELRYKHRVHKLLLVFQRERPYLTIKKSEL